jgi:GntR family transcriptional regulator
MTNTSPAISLMPLYKQVREQLTARLIDGSWQPGDVIPSEIQIAQELGVSQGTVRKALDEMVRDNILRRKQGRGTFVASSDDAEFVFQFFLLQPDDGERVLPTSETFSVKREKANAATAKLLDVARGTDTIRIERSRSLNDRAVISETVILLRELFDDFPTVANVPNNLYNLYAKRWRSKRASGRIALVSLPYRRVSLFCQLGNLLIGSIFQTDNMHGTMRVTNNTRSRCAKQIIRKLRLVRSYYNTIGVNLSGIVDDRSGAMTLFHDRRNSVNARYPFVQGLFRSVVSGTNDIGI